MGKKGRKGEMERRRDGGNGNEEEEGKEGEETHILCFPHNLCMNLIILQLRRTKGREKGREGR